MRRFATLALALAATALSATSAFAFPVATNDAQYQGLGRIFPDPLAGCVQGGPAPCSPNAQGNAPSTQFIQFNEFVNAVQFMNSKPEWQRYLEVLPLDGRMGENDGDAEPAGSPRDAFPGNTMGEWEFTPKAEFKSVGLATTTRERSRSDLYVLRVTDENVPDSEKQKYVTALSIHGIERAGVEGGTRAAEDLVTAFTTGKHDDSIVPEGTLPNAPTFGDTLRKMIIYFVYPNPDGWRRGSVTEGGVFFQRYNGNGVDLNRDWPDVGFSFRPYSTGSEPEVRAVGSALQGIDRKQKIDAGVDLHGMLTADALSYTLLGHGRHDWAKDTRIRTTARNIHVVSEKALAWSPLIVPNDTDKDTMGCADAAGQVEACAQIYGQTWGTVYDTINYTVTGSLGDWLDSPYGIGADGIDNEMAFSHLDRNIVFDPQGEQLHVDGNKGLIYAQVASMLSPPDQRYDAPGLKGYVANSRKTRAEADLQPAPPPGSVAQAKISGQNGTPAPEGITFPFTVKQGAQPADGSPDASKKIFNGGLRVDITKLNAQGISDGNAVTTLKVQCKFCDDHPGVEPEDDWVTVAEDYNQSPGYAQAGLTGAVNRPQVESRGGKKVEWRALLESTPPNLIDAGAGMDVEFFQGPATDSRDSSGFNPPRLAGYDVANTDLFEDLNKNIPDPDQQFRRIDPAAVGSGRENLDSYTSIVLSDVAPGRDAFLDKLQGWVRDGGNLVLTDSAARVLPEFVDLEPKKIKVREQYVGQLSFQTTEGEDDVAAIKHPLATTPHPVAQLGARFNSGLRRQVYEPVPLGFAIEHPEDTEDNSVGDNYAGSPAWDVEREAYERNPGAKTAATAVEEGPDGSGVELDRTTVGEAAVGKGRVRFIGALAPQPSQEFDHDFGLEPYSLTYTGHLLLRNALEWPARPIQRPGAPPPAGAPSGGGPIACTATNRGFRRVSVRGAGKRRLRIGFKRKVRAPITIDVFQTSKRRRVVQERLVQRFRGQFKPRTWNDRNARRNRKVTDGYYFVRLRMNLGSARADYRRVTLLRRGGRWYKRPPHYRKESCSLLTSYKLLRPVFGGPTRKGVTASFRVTRRSRASLTIMRGKRVIRRGRMRVRRADITYRQKLQPRRLPRGDYRFILRVRPLRGGRTIRSVLTSRRL